jgi:hypothetical protein
MVETMHEQKEESTATKLVRLHRLCGPPPVLSSEDPKSYEELLISLLECYKPKARFERAKLTYQMLVQSQNDHPTTMPTQPPGAISTEDGRRDANVSRPNVLLEKSCCNSGTSLMPCVCPCPTSTDWNATNGGPGRARRGRFDGLLKSSQRASLKKARALRRVRTVTEPSSPACCLDPRAGKAAEEFEPQHRARCAELEYQTAPNERRNLLPTFRKLPN